MTAIPVSLEPKVQPPAAPPAATREVRHEYSLNLPAILEQVAASLLVSTYQAGKLVVAGVNQGSLTLSYHNFQKAMGIAVGRQRLAIGSQALIWFLRSEPKLAPRVEPVGRHDGCFVARSAHFTGEIQAHQLAWSGDELWVVNTSFSCLCTLDAKHSFVPRWRPRFVSALAPEDRCHLNGLALMDGRPKYVTVLAETDTPQGWRPNKATSGCLIDVPSQEIVIRGLAMPHSPVVHEGKTWLLDSGTGRLVIADTAAGKAETIAVLPGYTRGLALAGLWAFVGLSKIRETSTFGGVPIAQNRDQLKCGVAVVDLRTGRPVALLEFHSGVEEIFDVALLPGVLFPALSGPYPYLDQGQSIWVVPGPG
jgi:uncharacterized protein (TIGR03032 family)